MQRYRAEMDAKVIEAKLRQEIATSAAIDWADVIATVNKEMMPPANTPPIRRASAN